MKIILFSYPVTWGPESRAQVLNFGFSGSGHMDIGIAKWLAKIDAAVFIVDCSWNMAAAEIARKTAPIVNYLRSQRLDTPIVLADGTPDGAA
jgi:hypothetical protein